MKQFACLSFVGNHRQRLSDFVQFPYLIVYISETTHRICLRPNDDVVDSVNRVRFFNSLDASQNLQQLRFEGFCVDQQVSYRHFQITRNKSVGSVKKLMPTGNLSTADLLLGSLEPALRLCDFSPNAREVIWNIYHSFQHCFKWSENRIWNKKGREKRFFCLSIKFSLSALFRQYICSPSYFSKTFKLEKRRRELILLPDDSPRLLFC